MERAGWNYPSGEFRVSDADRDRALSELSEAFQAGRITADEFDQRSEHALRARTGNELTALLADLPVANVPATPTPVPGRAQRIVAARVGFAASVAAICFAAVAAGNALSTGPTIQQRELLRDLAARQGMPVPQFPHNPGFDWAGTITPGVIAVLLVVLVIYVRVRVARGDR
jgi:hypothetical protein